MSTSSTSSANGAPGASRGRFSHLIDLIAGAGACIDSDPSAGLRAVSVPVPFEILREIFLHTLSSYPAVELDDFNAWKDDTLILKENTHRAVLPFHLARVSRSWRRVALHTAELWTWLSFGPHPHGTLILRPDYLRAMLARSRYAPLDIYIDVCPSLSRNAWVAAGDAVCSALLGAAARWRFLYVQMPPFSNIASVAALLDCNAPGLESLVIGHSKNCCWSDYRRSQEPAIGAISLRLASSKLQSIEISRCTLEGLLIEPTTTFPSLVYVRLDNVDMPLEALWQMLSSAGNLQRLCLVDLGRIEGPAWCPPQAARLRLPHLRELYYASPACPEVLLEWAAYLDVPCLEYLRVQDIDEGELLALAPCMHDSLRRFCHSYNGDQDLVPVFAALPHLREVNLTADGGIPDAALLCAMADGAILPELETLILDSAYFVWHIDSDNSDFEWYSEHTDNARAAARALLDLARTRNSGETHGMSGGFQPPRLKLVQFETNILENEFVDALRELVPVRLL